MNKKDKSKYCTFYIVRHGETEWNAKKIIQGHKDSPLTETGIKQAKQTANIFKKIKFDEIYSSDLLRAKRTAEIIVLEKKMAVETTKLLRERKMGRFEGKKVKKMREGLKKQFEKVKTLSKEARLKFYWENGIETDEEIISRFITFLRETAVAYPHKNILIVTHGAIIRMFLVNLGWAEYDELSGTSIDNTGYIIIESDGVDFFIKEVAGINKQENEN